MIRAGAQIAIAAAGRIGRIITFSVHALHRVRADIIILGTIPRRPAFGALPDFLALAGHTAKGFIRSAAGSAGGKRAAHTGFIRTLVGAGALIPVRAAGRVRRIHAFSADTARGVSTNVGILRARVRQVTFRAIPRILTIPRNAAERFCRRTA